MNPVIKARWVAALRSGEYEQGRGGLRKGDAFCCLGVLCDLAIKDGQDIVASRAIADRYIFTAGDDDFVAYLPEVVSEWAGLQYVDPDVTADFDGELQRVQVSALNDGGRSFEEIADLIEEQL